MKLKDFVKENKNKEMLLRKVSRQTLWKFLNLKAIPKNQNMKFIYEISNHSVAPNDFYFEIWEKEREEKK